MLGYSAFPERGLGGGVRVAAVVYGASYMCFDDKSGRRGKVERQRAHPDVLSHTDHGRGSRF